ncbi:unnamed protein product [Linum trigynum]|uniref:RRM domain-containing protein n=1 Tax=Linum trigynum TaxID=586398 RepID=A0AAV2DFD4_9ROSI
MEEEIKQQPSKLFVGGVNRTTTGQELEKHFQKYGQVKDAFIVYCKQTSRSRGFGFVEFEDASAADLALNEDHIILGQKVDVCRPKPKKTDNNETAACNEGESHRRSKRVFVGGLPSTITPEEFRSSFQSFGEVSSATIVCDKHSGKPRGFGFITFESEDSADRALKNRFYQLNGSQVEVKRANSKNNAFNNFARRNHEYSVPAALNHSSYVNGYYHYWYNLLHQHTSGLPYYWVPPPGMMGNYYYGYQSCYPMAAANCASLSGGWSYGSADAMLHSYGETDIVGRRQEEDETNIADGNGAEDHAWEVLRNLDEVNGLSVDQQGAYGEIRIAGSKIPDNEETGTEHHVEQVWSNSDRINSELSEIKFGNMEHLEAAVGGKIDEAESGIGDLGEVDRGNAEVVSRMVTYSIENGKIDGWSMERKPAMMVAAACIHT